MNLKTTLKQFAVQSKLYKLFAPIYSGRGSIVMLHRVLEQPQQISQLGNQYIETTADLLNQFIQYFIDRNYEFITLGQLPGFLNSKIKNKFVIFTFDDGYKDNLTVAYPIFERHNIPMHIYISTSMIDHHTVLWWYMLEELLQKHQYYEFMLDDTPYSFDLSTLGLKKTAFQSIRTMILKSDNNLLMDTLQQVFKSDGRDIYAAPKDIMLNWEELRMLASKKNVVIGCHTVNHLSLSTLNESDIYKEIFLSKEILENKLAIKIEHFAYPFGDRLTTTQREFNIVRNLGFKTATTTRTGNIFNDHLEHMECLPRLSLGGLAHPGELKFLLSGMSSCFKNYGQQVILH